MNKQTNKHTYIIDLYQWLQSGVQAKVMDAEPQSTDYEGKAHVKLLTPQQWV